MNVCKNIDTKLIDNFSEVIHRIKFKYGMIIENEKCVELNTKVVNAAFITQTLKMIQYYANIYVSIKVTEKSFIKT